MEDERKAGHPNVGEREFEIGKDEAWFANVKRTFDEFLNLSLEHARKTQLHFDKLISDAQQHDNDRQTIATQALQNAVETANMTAKQAVRHGDIAIDRQWNVDEQSHVIGQILKNETFQNAIAATVAKVVADMTAA